MQDIFDYKRITKEVIDRVSNNPVEASGCIQSLYEYLARRDAEIEKLYESLELLEHTSKVNADHLMAIIDRYVFAPRYLKVWRAIFPGWGKK